MNNLKLRYSTKLILKEKDFRFYSIKDSLINISIINKKLKLYANVNNEFLDLHSLKTNRILIPIVNSFKYHNSKIYVFEVQMLYKTKTADIKKSLINLIDELCKSFRISKNDKKNIYKLIIMYTNFCTYYQIDSYLKDNERIAA